MKVKCADSFFKKLKGLMFLKKFDYILKISCNGVHTFFMRVNIDIVLTDKNNKILYIYRDVKPNRIIIPKKKVTFTYEMPQFYSDNYKIGNIFKS